MYEQLVVCFTLCMTTNGSHKHMALIETETAKFVKEFERANPDMIGLTAGFLGWRARFLIALAQIGTILGACSATGIPRQTVYYHTQRNPEFRKAADAAQAHAVGKMEALAFSMAAGWKGKDPDGQMVRFILRSRMPEVYGDRKVIMLEDNQQGGVDEAQLGGQERLEEVMAELEKAGVMKPHDVIEGQFVKEDPQ